MKPIIYLIKGMITGECRSSSIFI